MNNRRLMAAAVAGCAFSWAALGATVARAESTAPADSKSVTAPKPASEEKPTGNGTPSTQAKPGADKPAAEKADAEKKKFTKPQIEAFLSKCSQEADEKGLTKAKNKMAERKAYRRQCMSKFGIEPKSAD